MSNSQSNLPPRPSKSSGYQVVKGSEYILKNDYAKELMWLSWIGLILLFGQSLSKKEILDFKVVFTFPLLIMMLGFTIARSWKRAIEYFCYAVLGIPFFFLILVLLFLTGVYFIKGSAYALGAYKNLVQMTKALWVIFVMFSVPVMVVGPFLRWLKGFFVSKSNY